VPSHNLKKMNDAHKTRPPFETISNKGFQID